MPVVEEYSAQLFVSPQQYAASVNKNAARILEYVKKTAAAAAVPCSCTYATNDYPFTEIAKAARRNKRDLIVMASHGRRGLSRLILGSETSKDLEAEYYGKKSRE